MPDYHTQTVPNPYQFMVEQDIEEDDLAMLQVRASRGFSRSRESSQASPILPGIMQGSSRQMILPDALTSSISGSCNAPQYSPEPPEDSNPVIHAGGIIVPDDNAESPITLVAPPSGSDRSCGDQATHRHYTKQQRLGEAAVPGPSQDPPLRWALGAINPTGLAGKAVLFTDLPAGIYAISETHLTARGKARFKQELWYAKSPLALTTGHDAPYKKANMRSIGGKHTGVGFLSTFPSRPINTGWKTELYQSSRLHAATFQINNVCIAGGVCYGYAQAADSRATQDMTDQLLSQLTSAVVEGFPGPAFIAGDFNQVPGTLSEPAKWESKGWRDVQTWAQELWGIVPGPTCCQVTRKDYVYLSPALQQLLLSCSNSFDKFPDHSTLLGILDYPSPPVPIARWPKPTTIDYKELDPAKIASHHCAPVVVSGTPTERYAAICQAFEQHVSSTRVHHQLSALQPAQRGRGSTLERIFIKPHIVPIKNARQGDYQPSINSWSLLHCRWVTQCRRLQHYVKHVKKASSTPTALEHRASIWRAIVLASGFPHNFATWWNQQALQDGSLYPWFPPHPPDLTMAQHIAQVFQARLAEYESQLIAKRVGIAKVNRANDVNRVYKDVRKPMPVPVKLLVAKSVAHVTEIVDEGSVIVNCSQAIQLATVLESRTGPLHIIHIEEDQIWFTSPHTLEVGDVLAEVNLKGQINEIHDAFISEWMRRWDRHRHLAPNHWEEVLSLTESLLRGPVMELQPITLAKWKSTLRSKKASSATGLDSLSRKDLLAFPDELHNQLIDLFHHAEATGQWPRQLLQGAVHSLEKTPGAETVNEYRPITIMPLAYRIYSSIRSRQILLHLKKHVPPTLLGNIPGRQATQLWWSMQHRIELALQASEPLNGATSHVVKAFNHLPREVTFKVAACMGIHPNIIRAWAASTTQLRSHFVVQNSPSMQVQSTTGFVEGCGLSVVAMVLINTLLHAYLQHKHPDVTFTTYVDNFELQSGQVVDTSQALQSLHDFCGLLDIQLDTKKTYRWSVSAAGRQEIRASAANMVTSARDLGAHMQFDSRQTNATVVNKFKALPDLWHLLSKSQASYEQKIKVLRTVAWPRAMYAISTVHVGNAHFIDARAGAFQAIGGTKAGANPQIHLSLTTYPTADPEFYALWNTVTQFRRNIVPELVDVTLAPAAVVPSRKRKPGPGGVLISRLEAICWAYQRDGVFSDGEGSTIHILDAPLQELKTRLVRGWQQTVGRQWETRKGFQGLRFVSTELSRPDTKLAPDELGFLRVAQNGTFYTNDTLMHAGVTDNALCKFCSSPDSVFHRHWECTHTLPSRQLIPESIRDFIMQSPKCLQENGWAVESDEIRHYRTCLGDIPDTITKYVNVNLGTKYEHCDLFCDGTGIDPKQPATRLVAWGVVMAGQDPQQPHVPIAWGGVPGQHQTVARAELIAFISALQYGVLNRKSPQSTFAIWSDCEFVIRRARAIQLGLIAITASISDHDLWQLVQTLLPPEEICRLHHIKSHQMYQDSPAWIQWACSANDAADKLAEFAISALPAHILQSQAAASSSYRDIQCAVQFSHQHIVRVARLAVAEADRPKSAPFKPVDHHPVIPWHQIALAAADRAPAKLRFEGFHTLVSWLQQIHDPSSAPKWYSWYELLFAFQIITGEWGIQSTSSHNTWKMYDKIQEYDMRQTCRSWSSYLIQLIRLILPEFKAEDSRPNNSRFRCWAMGVMSQLKPEVDKQIHDWLQQQMGDRPITKITNVIHLPVANLSTPVEPAAAKHGLHRFWPLS